ncbi:hypothetical protein KIW84_050700 [Lathyrus oleraceus]|uniref:Retrovirus-related Pol polyprotein from transposon TNT 1-94 n=1 Tax=Pisum sativum TaxID=3888 RepID=A0A9D5ACT1_PEA|nr:hypothetical protein KIW84_050700 [Pisum sativum]
MYTPIHDTAFARTFFGGDKLTLVGYSDFDMIAKVCSIVTTETEFTAITEAYKELLWLKKFLQELGFVQDKYVLFVDSQSVIHLGKVHTNDNGFDMMSKVLPEENLKLVVISPV